MALIPTRDQIRKWTPHSEFQVVMVQFGAADTDLDITHTLNPPDPEMVDYNVLQASGPPLVYQDMSPTRVPWQNGVIRLRSSIANLKVRLLLTVSASPTKFEGGGTVVLVPSAVYAAVENVASVTVTHGVFTSIPWDTTVFDSGGIHSTSVNPSRMTIPTGGDGTYVTGCSIFITSSAGETGQFILRPMVNGAVVDGGIEVMFSPGGGQNMGLNGSTLLKLKAGDYVEWQVDAVSANNQSILAAASPNYYNPRAWLVRI